MSGSMHPGEQLAELVDGRLGEAETAAVRAHLEQCAECRAVLDELQMARTAARVLHGDVPMPADLVAAVARTLDRADADARPTRANAEAGAEPTRIPVVLRALVGLAAAAALAALYVQVPSVAPIRLDLPALVARDLGEAGSRSLPFAVTSADAAVLERYFAETPGPRVRVIDLDMMQITLEGAVRHMLNGRPSALYAYRTPSGGRLVCQMYEGALGDLPPPAETREQNGFRFEIYRRGAVTLVFWQEGDLVCVLGSELPAEEVIALAVAKAMAPA